MVIKKGNNESQFRDFLRRNGLILLLIIMTIGMLITLIISKKNEKNIEKEITNKNNIIKINKKNNNLLKKSFKKIEKIKKNDNKNFSCNDILKSGKNKSGFYEIFIKNTDEKLKVYCDMQTSGGGWTLVLTSKEGGWKFNEVSSINTENPSLKSNYSILNKADFIKTIVNGKFKYRIDARFFGENGGVWEASQKYSFVSQSKYNTDINLLEKYGNWKYYTFGIEKRMPYLCNAKYALLTTSINCNSKWFGTLVSGTKSFSPAPWIHSTMKNPKIIWYWVK